MTPQPTIDPTGLHTKIQSIDPATLTTTVQSRLDALATHPETTVHDRHDWIPTIDDPAEDDHTPLIRVLRTLAMTVVAQHLLETTDLEDPTTHDHPIKHVILHPKTGVITVKTATDDHDPNHRSSGKTNEITLRTSCKTRLEDLVKTIDSVRLGRDRRTTISNLPYSKIVLDLLLMDDHSPAAIDAYAASQHDWCLSSVFVGGMKNLIGDLKVSIVCPDTIQPHHEIFARAVVTSLIHGCAASIPHPADPVHKPQTKTPTPIINGLLGFYDHQRTAPEIKKTFQWETTCGFVRSVAASSFMPWDDDLTPCDSDDDLRGFIRSASIGISHLLKTDCGVHAVQGHREILKAKDSIGAKTIMTHYRNLQEDPTGTPVLNGVDAVIYRRTHYDLKFYNRVDLAYCSDEIDTDAIRYRCDVPPDLRGKVTRDLLAGLESKTHFIRNAVLCGVFTPDTIRVMETVLGNDGSLDPGLLHDFASAGILRFGHYITPWFYTRASRAFKELSGPGWMEPFQLLSFFMLDTVLSFDRGDADHFPEDVVGLYSILKAWAVHLLVHFHEADPIIDPHDDVSTFERFVMGDVLRSIPPAHASGVISLDEEADWYGKIVKACRDAIIDPYDHHGGGGDGVCGNGSGDGVCGDHRRNTLDHHDHKVDPLDMRDIKDLLMDVHMADSIVSMFCRMMPGGDLHPLDETFGRIEDALIDTIMDHYLTRLHGDGDGRLPDGFVFEELRMDAAGRYKDAVESGRIVF